MPLINELRAAIGTKYVLQGDDTAGWRHDWIGKYENTPLAVLRPANTAEVSTCVKLAHDAGTPVVPVSGNTGLAGGAHAAEGSLMLSLDRMNKIRDIRPDARLAIVEGGVVLEALHDAVGAQGLSFPMAFGAKGSAMIAGMLSTNAGGSNVLRYGNTRDLCLGLEVVLPDGEVLDLMSELHKDNSGYDLRDLFIGAEGTLGIITGAVLKLVPTPAAFATAMVAVPTLSDALLLLNKLQEVTGGAVEAFEYMPAEYMAGLHRLFPATRRVFDEDYAVNILLEIGATAPRDVTLGDDGAVPIVSYLEEVLGDMLEHDTVLDAVIAQNDAQRVEMWARREAAAEVSLSRSPAVNNDIALPLDKIDVFFTQMDGALKDLDANAETLSVAHLGDGNIHYMVYPSDASLCDKVMEAVEQTVVSLGGSFSAEHGIGLSKLPSMQRRKNPVALRVMGQIKAAIDPKGIMNPGKVLPE